MQASTWIDTTKSPRLTTDSKANAQHYPTKEVRSLSTLNDFKSLEKGDRIAYWCPMMKKTVVTTVSNVDTKGHAQIRQTRQGLKMDGCNIVLKRKSGSREVDSMMVCQDGTLRPIACRLM